MDLLDIFSMSFSWDGRSQQSNRVTHKLSPPVPYTGCSFPPYTSRNRSEAYWSWVSQILPSDEGMKDSADRNQLWCFLTSRWTTAFQRPLHCSFEWNKWLEGNSAEQVFSPQVDVWKMIPCVSSFPQISSMKCYFSTVARTTSMTLHMSSF